MRPARHASLLSISIWFLTACASQRVDDPLEAMLRRDRGPAAQIRALQQARDEMPADPRRLEALHDLVWRRGYGAQVRIVAIDELVRIDEEDFRRKLARRIKLVQNWDTLNHLFDLGIQRQWPGFTGVLVRNWARPAHGMSDDQRPERRAIQRLHPDRPVQEVVFDVFARPDDEVSEDEQIAAWQLLNRISDPAHLIQFLQAAPPTTPLVELLKSGAQDLHVVPSNREGVLWLKHLRAPGNEPHWAAASDAVTRLSAQQRLGLQLRHLPVLWRLDASDLGLTRAEVYAQVHARVSPAEHHLKGPTYDAPMQDWPQGLSEAAGQLCWADLMTIRMLLQAAWDPEVVATLFQQARADVADTGTEYGGIIDRRNAHYTAQPYAPLARQHDFKFIPPPEMIEHMYTALAHYHLHAQRVQNRAHAGPGRGDLRLVDRLNLNGLVFTSIDEDRLNVDYYQPGQTVVDLGTIIRGSDGAIPFPPGEPRSRRRSGRTAPFPAGAPHRVREGWAR